jgi:hypothetical protein
MPVTGLSGRHLITNGVTVVEVNEESMKSEWSKES